MPWTPASRDLARPDVSTVQARGGLWMVKIDREQVCGGGASAEVLPERVKGCTSMVAAVWCRAAPGMPIRWMPISLGAIFLAFFVSMYSMSYTALSGAL